MNPESGWQVIREFGLRRHTWNGETVLFQEGSGDTHLLGHVESLVVDTLQQRSATIPELVESLSANFEQDAVDEYFIYIEQVLDQLERLGIIERVKS